MPEWSGSLVRAWKQLRHDRNLGAMGAVGGIYYSSISAYAADHNTDGWLFDEFVSLLRAMDDEYVLFAEEAAKKAAEKARRERESRR